MGENSNIAWTDNTFNPWIGCQKVSPGCDNCYAETLMDKRWHKVDWGPHGKRIRTSESNWRKPVQWNESAKRRGVRTKVFCASLADWLDNRVPKQWRVDLAALIDATPHLDWLMLTKRIENFSKLAPWWSLRQVPANVWLGITCEDQAHYDRRWPILQKIDAPVRFVSYEPAIGQLQSFGEPPYPDWFICGGESGVKPRMMDPNWARQVQHGCKYQDLAFFMKQMTALAPIPGDLMVRQFPTPRAA